MSPHLKEQTPLVDAQALSNICGVKSLWLKDESKRMGLGSFKALGGAFALAQMIIDMAGREFNSDLTVSDLSNSRVKDYANNLTFITASAGNHGLSVAYGAKLFSAKAVIVLAKTVPDSFAKRLERLNATVIKAGDDYEQSVDFAKQSAEKNNWLLLADGSWPGYTEPPSLVMEGYSVLAKECGAYFSAENNWPTHVFLQAGVGGLAASVTAYIRQFWNIQPRIIIVEPDAAPCLLESVKNRKLTTVSGEVSNMGRLDCKQASIIAYDVLVNQANFFISISDNLASEAVLVLKNHGLETTPSGAAGLAGVLASEHFPEIGLSRESQVLSLITEGV